MLPENKVKTWIVLSVSLFILMSCGASRTIMTTEEATIGKDYANNDVLALIEDLQRYPMSRNLTEQILFSELNYENCTYSDLKSFSKAADFDYKAFAFFDSLKFDRQEKVLSSLIDQPIQAIGDYYRRNADEHEYLQASLMPLFSGIDTLDYELLKRLNSAFDSTDLQFLVKPHYYQVRDSLLSEIYLAVEGYFNAEQSLADQVEIAIRSQCENYIEQGVTTIISSLKEKEDRGFFKRVFQRQEMDNLSFEEYADTLIKQNLDFGRITNIVNERLFNWINSSNEYRQELIETYFDNISESCSQLRDSLETPKVFDIRRHDIEKIESIKFTGSLLSWGSFALGFVPGIGWFAPLVADVADFGFSLKQDGMINESMMNLTTTLYEDCVAAADKYVSAVFGNLKSDICRTREIIMRKLDEEF